MVEHQLSTLLLAARQSLKNGEAKRAVEMAQAGLKLDGRNALAHFLLGSAHAALAAPAAAAASFLRAKQLTADAAPGTQRHQLHVTAEENLLLECTQVLPAGWIATLHDAPRLAALQAGITAAVAAAATGQNSSPARVLVCGGFGLEAAIAAQAGAARVAVICPGNQLAAELAAQLAADSGCADGITVATSMAQLQQHDAQQEERFNVLILADALGSSISWQLVAEQMAAVAALLAPAEHLVVLPHAVHISAALVQCRGAVLLNEVDVEALQEDTCGLDLSPANSLLPRSRRSVQLPSYHFTQLADSTRLLSIRLASLLPDCACGCNRSSDDSSSIGSTSAAILGHAATLAITSPGGADALCWWYEQELLGSSSVAATNCSASGASLQLTADPASAAARDATLHPHIWQHVQYLNHDQLTAGQAVEVRCSLGASRGAAPGGTAGAADPAGVQGTQQLSLPGPSKTSLELQFHVLRASPGSGGSTDSSSSSSLLLQVGDAEAAAAVPRYHTSMLNDSCRTAVYQRGIASALQQASERAATADASSAGQPPVVLEIGSGSGLLCMLGCQAGAARIIGCERLRELQAAAAQLLAANGLSDRVTILPKHSKELTVACEGEEATGAGPDLPRRADVLLHEIFGTDPFSEGVVPTLIHAKQHLLHPAATLAPCKVHVVAAVAASAGLHRLLRPPASVCGGRICTSALQALAPRKVDCQAGEADLVLLTEPGRVLSVDFEDADLALADSCTALLELLPRPAPLADWLAAQQGTDEAVGQQPITANGSKEVSGRATSLAGAALYAVAWFEYEFPGGVTGSTAPGVQRSEHWEQVVQPMEGAAAEAALAAVTGSDGAADDAVTALLLTAGYRVDRLWFELEGLAAASPDSSNKNDD